MLETLALLMSLILFKNINIIHATNIFECSLGQLLMFRYIELLFNLFLGGLRNRINAKLATTKLK